MANVPSTTTAVGVITRIGSPVVAATVVTAEQTSFPDLREPVIVAVRLNPVLEGVSCARFYLLNTSSLMLSFLLALQSITRCTCVSWDFSLAGNMSPQRSSGSF